MAAASGSNSVCHRPWSIRITLSGGATGCAPGGAPMVWKSEFA